MTDPFIPVPKVLETQLQVMELLLAHGAFLIVSTKGHIPNSFVTLFAAHPARVRVQVGINTAHECMREAIEPDTADVTCRLNNCSRLTDAGVDVVGRIDPIIPGLSDDEKGLADLTRDLSACGVKHLVASYLFLRRSIRWRGSRSAGAWSYEQMVKQYFSHQIEDFCSGGTALLVQPEYRRRRYAALQNIANRYGVSVTICGCKNPDIATTCCMARPKG